VRQATADSRNVYGYIANPVSNYRPYPTSAPVGIVADRLGNAQSQVDLESLLRNQSYVLSKDPQYRAQADACFAPYMQQQLEAPLPCVAGNLMPQVTYMSRACDPLSGAQIDRFDFLQYPGQGFQYSYGAPQFGQNTVQQLKDEIARNRPKQ
jgi:hypothetical protein